MHIYIYEYPVKMTSTIMTARTRVQKYAAGWLKNVARNA